LTYNAINIAEEYLGMASAEKITQLLHDCSNGDKAALTELMSVIYQELHRMADYYMGLERKDHTLQATALVHEVYIRLVDQSKVDWKNRAHFFGAAAQLMRRILIDYARGHNRAKRGGNNEKIPLDEAVGLYETPDVDLIALDDALSSLAKIDSLQSRLVELRFFGGLSIEEAAEILDISTATANREWAMAKARLYRELKNI
jgi:RNA polymerase sigma-70 factor, ECF subfamily